MPSETAIKPLAQRRFAHLVALFRLNEDTREFAQALWDALIERATPDGAVLTATQLPLLEEALFWALAARTYQHKIATDGFLTQGLTPPTPNNPAARHKTQPTHSPTANAKLGSVPPRPTSSSKTYSPKDRTNPSAKQTPCESSASSVAALIPHPLIEPYAKACERYRKLLKEIAPPTEKNPPRKISTATTTTKPSTSPPHFNPYTKKPNTSSTKPCANPPNAKPSSASFNQENFASFVPLWQ